jgi:hypothetical protein
MCRQYSHALGEVFVIILVSAGLGLPSLCHGKREW